MDEDVSKEIFDWAYARLMVEDDVEVNALIAPTPKRPCPGCKFHICKTDFQGYGVDYLMFAAGDRIEILTTPDDAAGWMYGRHFETGDVGWFPPTYISKICFE